MDISLRIIMGSIAFVFIAWIFRLVAPIAYNLDSFRIIMFLAVIATAVIIASH